MLEGDAAPGEGGSPREWDQAISSRAGIESTTLPHIAAGGGRLVTKSVAVH